jgi:hypothetical protein
MAIILPTDESPAPALRVDPAILIVYGAKKVGKTGEIMKLPGCCDLDGENGTDIYQGKKLKFSSIKELDDILAAIRTEGARRVEANKVARLKKEPEPYPGDGIFPYRYLALDTIDSLEEKVIPWKTTEYKASTLGKKFEGDSIMDLDHGGGYYHLREGVKKKVLDIAACCKTLIIVSHLAEKETNKGGVVVTSQDISLTGKLAQIIAAMADAIGYMYRKPGAPGTPDKMFISFRTTEGVTMGARQKHLAGQTFEFDWSKIFIDDPVLKPTGLPKGDLTLPS